ncbi:NAD-dependent epimerase/dehydratase family protein [Neoroseomonas rubea]|uniref:NAD-dependent epimerase/dehydratase family protein n=1 Tax=Neoroseomonas rubea TaxID=2748666 RepID=UPI0018DF69FF|nr:NAD(P)-dependent oxidoreductase [Roseomonas rubea]
MQQDSKRILITGSSGFLGAAVAARLARAGHDVLGLDPVEPAAGAPHRHLAEDLSDPSRIVALLMDFRPDAVIHAGGVSGPMVLADAPQRVMAINLRGSLNLLDASLAAQAGRFVFCSSISAIGEFVDGPLPDDPPMRPNTTYGASKAAFDQVLSGLSGRCPMEMVSLRFTAIYGPGRQTAMPIGDVVAAAIRGVPVRVPRQPPWPYIFIDDAADATITAALRPTRPLQLHYNIAHPDLVSLDDVAVALRAAGLRVEMTEDPSLPSVARGPMDVEAAARDFDFRARIDHRQGIARMISAATGTGR